MFRLRTTLTCLLAFATLLSISGEKYGLRDDEHPSVVHVEISGDPRNVPGCCPRCSGVLISLKHVATVATCLWSVQDTQPKPNDIQVYAGTSEVSGKIFNDNVPQWGYGACSRSVQRVQAIDVIYHKKFHPQFFSLQQDVALIVIPKLEQNRFVQPIEMSFDMFESNNAKQCKIVGFGILKFPRAGYFNLLTWLQPMTRWERDVTVKNGCMGKPGDWSKKKWAVMTHGSVCSAVYSSESRVCWNDRGAALICNGLLSGLVQAQYEDDGKLDLSLRQCSGMEIASPNKNKRERYQVIFFNMKYIAELIPEQLARTKDLQWTGNLIKHQSDLAIDADNAESLNNSSTVEEPSESETSPEQWEPVNFLGEMKMKRPSTDLKLKKKPTTVTHRNLTSTTTAREPPSTNQTEQPISTQTTTVAMTTAVMTTEEMKVQTVRYEEYITLPEWEMDLRTNDREDEEANVHVEDVFNENNPFNKSNTNVLTLALILNVHTQRACTGVFITPQSVLTGASCLVRKQENYQSVGVGNYRVITGHSNGLVDFCSDRIKTFAVQNVSLLDRGLRQDWQIYKKSRITPFTEIYNLAVITIAGTHLSNTTYVPIGYDTWKSPMQEISPAEDFDLARPSTGELVEEMDESPMQCKMFGYGHLNFPYTNQKDRIGIKSIDLEIVGNCSQPFFDHPFGEQTENLWLHLESPHFFCAVNVKPNVGPSAGSIGSPLYCGPNLVGLYVGRYNNATFDSSLGPAEATPGQQATHVFLKLDHYNDWITDVLTDESVVQLRLGRLPPSQAPTSKLSLVTMGLLLCVTRLIKA